MLGLPEQVLPRVSDEEAVSDAAHEGLTPAVALNGRAASRGVGPRWARVITGPEVLPHIGPGEVLIANDAAQPGRWPFRFWPHRPKSERIRRSCAQRTESQMARLLPLTATRAPSCGLVE